MEVSRTIKTDYGTIDVYLSEEDSCDEWRLSFVSSISQTWFDMPAHQLPKLISLIDEALQTKSRGGAR